MPSGSPQSGVGRVIAGRYLLRSRLGAGAMGHVWLAHDPSLRVARLVSCFGTHDQQVLGFTRLGQGTTLTEAKSLSDAACARDVPPKDLGYDPSRYEAASWTGKSEWMSGTHLVVCTVRRQNGGTMGKDEP